MNILLTADPELPVPPRHYGGIERIVDGLVREYKKEGHEVALVAHPESTSPADRRFPWKGAQSQSRMDTLKNLFVLSKAVRKFQPDILHSFSRLAYMLPILPSRLPKVMSYQRHVGGRQVTLAAKLGGGSLRFTGCSEFICEMGRPSGGTWNAIPNFVNLSQFPFSAQRKPDAPLLFLSRIESIKGPEIAIEIAKQAGRRLILAGNHAAEGAEYDFWKTRIEPELGHNGIEYFGEADDPAKARLMSEAAALIVPIQWDEPFGIVFIEALACGTPVISCARGALPEFIVPGKHGFFIHSVEEGVDAVKKLNAIRASDCRARVEEKFSSTVVASQYLHLYSELL